MSKIARQYNISPHDTILYRVVTDEKAKEIERYGVTIMTQEEFLATLPQSCAFEIVRRPPTLGAFQ